MALEPELAVHVTAATDVRMSPAHTDEGLHAALSIHRSHPLTGMLVFSRHIETRYAAELLTGDPEGVGYRAATSSCRRRRPGSTR